MLGWQTSTSVLPVALSGHEAFAFGRRVFVLGGTPDGATANPQCYSAVVSQGGDLGQFQATASVPPSLETGGTLIDFGFAQNPSRKDLVYVLGGSDPTGATPYAGTFIGRANTDGGLTWTPGQPLPAPLAGVKAAICGDWLYAIGGDPLSGATVGIVSAVAGDIALAKGSGNAVTLTLSVNTVPAETVNAAATVAAGQAQASLANTPTVVAGPEAQPSLNGVGGITTVYTSTPAHTKLVPGTVVLTETDNGGGNGPWTDDGAGNIAAAGADGSGDAFTGTVNYVTGVITLTFAIASNAATRFTLAYSYDAALVFTTTPHALLVPGTVVLHDSIGPSGPFTDDGAGNISGTSAGQAWTGVINYVSGLITMTFAVPPSASAWTADYHWRNATTVFTTTPHALLVPGTVVLHDSAGPTGPFTDDGSGAISGTSGGQAWTATVNYITGLITLTYAAAPTAATWTADYHWDASMSLAHTLADPTPVLSTVILYDGVTHFPAVAGVFAGGTSFGAPWTGTVDTSGHVAITFTGVHPPALGVFTVAYQFSAFTSGQVAGELLVIPSSSVLVTTGPHATNAGVYQVTGTSSSTVIHATKIRNIGDTAVVTAPVTQAAVAVGATGDVEVAADDFPALASVFAAKLQSDGSLGAWVRGTDCPAAFTGTPLTGHLALGTRKYLYVVGGQPEAVGGSQLIYRGTPEAGTTGFNIKWDLQGFGLDGIRVGAGAPTLFPGKFIVAGGSTDGTAANALATCDESLANPDGSVRAASQGSQLPAPVLGPKLVVCNGWLFSIGGQDVSAVQLATIAQAQLQSDGSF
jgi:hypothetical protein